MPRMIVKDVVTAFKVTAAVFEPNVSSPVYNEELDVTFVPSRWTGHDSHFGSVISASVYKGNVTDPPAEMHKRVVLGVPLPFYAVRGHQSNLFAVPGEVGDKIYSPAPLKDEITETDSLADRFLRAMNELWSLIIPPHVDAFNRLLLPKDMDSGEYMRDSQDIWAREYKASNGDTLGALTTLAIFSNVTKRVFGDHYTLAAQIDENECIVGWQWFIPMNVKVD